MFENDKCSVCGCQDYNVIIEIAGLDENKEQVVFDKDIVYYGTISACKNCGNEAMVAIKKGYKG